VLLISDRTIPDAGAPLELVAGPGSRPLLDALLAVQARPQSGCDAFIRVRGDSPFMDPVLAARMLVDFRRYRAEYHFADGYPAGVSPEIVSTRILPALRALADKAPEPLGEEGLFSVIQKDINSFDLETEISRKDLREYRLSLTCDTRRNRMVCERLLNLGATDSESILDLVPSNLSILRTLPAFLSVQVSGGCPQSCSYCPYPRFGGSILERRDFMPVERYERLMEQAASLCGDAVVDLSLWGEPSLHPDFPALVRSTLRHPGLSLIVETSGLGWDKNVLEMTASAADGRLDWIVSLDETDPEAYARLRGPGFDAALSGTETLLRLFPGRVHVQSVRMKQNEERLEAFYRGWKVRTENVIIQKYDSFCGALPDLSVADLSPLERLPCWHLARDVSVLLEGAVPLCRECWKPGEPEGAVFLGNVFEEGLESVWTRGGSWFRLHLDRDYPDICGRCDEYHTYNA
ncbi:MAG TPA: spiro-SPASM protein, partial [Magnetospirillaceae bacterium]|nr:spiro-SPASM protein [Magnetospirillaceae bacterium]